MLSLLAALLLAPTAHAAGYYTSDVGVRAYSRGGAYVAGANDLLALWYNPAALTRLNDGVLTVNAAGVGQSVRFDRADVPGNDLGQFGPIENAAPAYVIPHFGAASGFGLENTTFAIGFYPPYAPDFAYPADGPQRYTLIDTLVIQTFSGLSVAHEFADWVSVGAGVSWNLLIVEQELAVNMVGSTVAEDPDFLEDPDFDVQFGMDGRDPFAIGWNIGVLVEPPGQRWAVGAMVQAPTQFTATGELKADFRDHIWSGSIIQDETAADKAVDFDVRMPLILKGGVLVRPVDGWEVELATVYEGWSSIERIVLTQVDLQVETSAGTAAITDDIVLPAGYQDAVSIRLGTEWDALDKLTLRAGGMWESTALPTENQGVGLVDGDKWGVGGGLTYRPHRRWAFDVGAFSAFIPERDIDNSTLRSIVVGVNPLQPEDTSIGEGSTIGNGRLSSSTLLLGGGVNWYFGRAPQTTGRVAATSGR